MEASTDKCHFSVSSKVCQINNVGGHPLSTYAKFSEKLTFLTPLIHTRTFVEIDGIIANYRYFKV